MSFSSAASSPMYSRAPSLTRSISSSVSTSGASTPLHSFDSSLRSPRILCLHGGGTTGDILRKQARALIRSLEPEFRLVFADAPFICAPHPAILPVYAGRGPYRRWLRWTADQDDGRSDAELLDEIEGSLKSAILDDNMKGATGDFVGLLGFSQGAKLAASILHEQELRELEANFSNTLPWVPGAGRVLGFAGECWRFAILMAGRGPFVRLRDHVDDNMTVGAGQIQEHLGLRRSHGRKLSLPTVHIHGLKDDGLHLHRALLDNYCEFESTDLVEWQGDHRLPLKHLDVNNVREAILAVAKRTEVLTKPTPPVCRRDIGIDVSYEMDQKYFRHNRQRDTRLSVAQDARAYWRSLFD